MNEVSVLKKLVIKYKNILINNLKDHPNILRIYEYFEDDKNFYIISELLTGGELFEKISSYYTFGE